MKKTTIAVFCIASLLSPLSLAHKTSNYAIYKNLNNHKEHRIGHKHNKTKYLKHKTQKKRHFKSRYKPKTFSRFTHNKFNRYHKYNKFKKRNGHKYRWNRHNPKYYSRSNKHYH